MPAPKPGSREWIIEKLGKDAIEIFNIAHGHDKERSPCNCHVCWAAYDKLSQWLAKHDVQLKERKP
jgi:hypothetical protein